MTADSYIQFISVLLIFVVILAVTYYVTKFLAGYQKEKSNLGNIEVIETGRLTTNKYIQIVRLGDKYMAVAVGKDEITALCEIDKDSLKLADDESQNASFKEIFDKFKSEIKGK
ncbi:flagellar protein FliO/FliZ [Butyrivibrio proteoclasticus]|uniref:Flagellar protein FliO/FliZ n=1 Tax=Butyrivibrio proteoclasticus TaxID=43305 RepID=A0A1I5QIN4_9FIRM|nr:flagellar biosynthetic protein FliO [Butyrivibrio proteoclasticus]SFP46174.1 flagellar protein FliO/FliZ [Butyrivibrio proteoclasticus]